MSDLMKEIYEDEKDYERACIIFGKKHVPNNLYEEDSIKLVSEMYKTKYNNFSKEYLYKLVLTKELPIDP